MGWVSIATAVVRCTRRGCEVVRAREAGGFQEEIVFSTEYSTPAGVSKGEGRWDTDTRTYMGNLGVAVKREKGESCYFVCATAFSGAQCRGTGG